MPRQQNATILIVEDEELIRSVFSSFLTYEGNTVIEAEDGAAGLALFRERRPDLLLLDLNLPGDVSGFNLLEKVVAESPETPVLIVSGAGTVQHVIKALQLGAWDFITKPVEDFTILVHAVARALERAELLRQKRQYQELLEYEVQKRTAELHQRTLELEKANQALKLEIEGRRQAQKETDRERAFLQTLLDGVLEPARVIDTEYRVLMMNQAARQLMQAAGAEDAPCYRALHGYESPCRGSGTPCILETVLEEGKAATTLHRGQGADGAERIYALEASPLWRDDGSLRGILEVCRDITNQVNTEEQLREHETRLYHITHHDGLTGLPNRLLFRDRLQRSMLKAQRSGNLVAVLSLGLDRFKKVNQTLGHKMGDLLLQAIAKRLESCLRKSDTVARLDGDQFGLILDDIHETQNVARVIQKMLDMLAEPYHIDGYELFATVSIGVGIYPADGVEVEELMRCAEAAMNGAKSKGRHTYQFYKADMNARALEVLLLENGLRKALDQKEFLLYYQPQYCVRSGRLTGMEALLRWKHPERGLVSPMDFIPLAEETGLIVPIGEWVLRTACLQNKRWQDQGLPPVRVAVNLSARQFRRQHIVALIEKTLEESGLAPEHLELELTESIVMSNAQDTVATLRTLKNMGVSLAIDDFGTGYSSLSYLKLFPIDILKIDRSFIKNITTDSNDSMIASSVIALAHSMKLKVVAEGVETDKQLELITKQGCDFVQGYYYSPPLPTEEFGLLLRSSGRQQQTETKP